MNDTIAAISTPHAPGAIGMIRVSGSHTGSILAHLLQKNSQTLCQNYFHQQKRRAIYCDFYDGSTVLDQVVSLFYPGPNSYTGEDVAEIFFHGNPLLLNRGLELIFIHGARPAENGEFTRRAYIHGKLDLTAAEAVHRVITARSQFELQLAQNNAFGKLKQLASQIRSKLIHLKAECEAEIDFSGEDLTYQSLSQREKQINDLQQMITEIIAGSERANSIINHSKIVLYGAPNTGKSSLLNALMGKERAIVSDIPGTTRDYISETIYIEGMPVQLVDTAGVRQTEDQVEKQGISRSQKEFDSADIGIYMLDASLTLAETDPVHSLTKSGNTIFVANKSDIAHTHWQQERKKLQKEKSIDILELSCKTGEGVKRLLELIHSKLQNAESGTEYILLEERNKHHFRQIDSSLQKAAQLMHEKAPPEIYIKEIDIALEEIGRVNGKVETEEVLGRIFSKFCVGK